jgi:hypothetical protein
MLVRLNHPLRVRRGDHKLIATAPFGADEIKVMKLAYQAALIELGVTNQDDPIADLVAKVVVNITCSGQHNPRAVTERGLIVLGFRSPARILN